MQGNHCPHCDKAKSASAAGAVHLYPIWNVHCDACCRRILAFYPEHSMSSMNMALIVGVKRGFEFVTAIQKEQRHAQFDQIKAAA